MKTRILIFIILLTPLYLFSQNRIPVCECKTIHLLCPDRVTYVEVGSPDRVQVEVTEALPNLVSIKATGSFEKETSLLIVCDGKLCSLLLVYRESKQLIYRMRDFPCERIEEGYGDRMPSYMMRELGNRILSESGISWGKRSIRQGGIRFRLLRVYQKNDYLLFEVQVTNHTNLAYDIGGFHWWIGDKRRLKATNVQEYEVSPVDRCCDVKTVPGNTTLREIFILPKLILPEQRILRVEMLEDALGNTGRKLSLRVKNRTILRARNI
jgi:conjugative transposon TraN protein